MNADIVALDEALPAWGLAYYTFLDENVRLGGAGVNGACPGAACYNPVV